MDSTSRGARARLREERPVLAAIFSASSAQECGIPLKLRFSGVCAVMSWRETVSTVSQVVRKLLKQLLPHRSCHPPLKRGVNEQPFVSVSPTPDHEVSRLVSCLLLLSF